MAAPVQRHRARYKSPGGPPWRETYRRRCMERLRSSRAQLLQRYRQAGDGPCAAAPGALLVQEVMEQEWQELRDRLPGLGGDQPMEQMLEDPDELAVLEEIQQELILQEQLVIEEYERSQRFDEECLNAMLDGLDATDRVICPEQPDCAGSLGLLPVWTVHQHTGYDRREASVTSGKHLDRAQPEVLAQP
ncbi:RPA-interacting protein isoform X3 [Oenanthe melanoleuca]|uniref:RPA-interacting protein isoform X3 n=1 Tax=Oenanthe melanoleuca TaxID=2939378 RepID=UPI0024C107FF|nr:RPA-interacting protein isoform X3 [Oenanthe melanoleuca]